ncbi:MAG: hypothetical protein LQ350_007992 [Teloschistes chrysophthalmus]|nr:MAG: hypothetical protein LQ350_007992 [Niorma chrysophthalma]
MAKAAFRSVESSIRSVRELNSTQGFTHFLRIPLATAQSTPQLLKYLEQVATDPITKDLPREAWRVLDEIHFNIAPVSLPKPSHVEAAVQLLQGMDLGSMLPQPAADIRDSANGITNSFSTSSDMSGKGGSSRQLTAPLVALQGLASSRHPNYPARARSIHFSIAEPQPFIEAFASRICFAFKDQSFVLFGGPPKPICASIMSTSVLGRDRIDERVDLKLRRRRYQTRTAAFDATDFHAKYKNFPWTTYFPLERLCLSQIGLKDVWREERLVRTAYRDTITIFFPGATADKSNAEHPQDVYTKARKSIRGRLPITPLVIPSTPP